MQILPQAEPDSCLFHSQAFARSLHIHGLRPDELGGLFRADCGRPDWSAIRARGLIRIRCGEDPPDTVNTDAKDYRLERLAGGEAWLASGLPGQLRLRADPRSDDRLLPGPLNLSLAQQWARQGLFPLHAAALRWEGLGLLILGDQGAGKSSLILAAIEQGAQVISDDWLLVGHHQGEPRAERLREFLMFRPGPTWERFGAAIAQRLTITRNRDGRHLHAISGEDETADFPAWTRLDRCLLLNRPDSTRPENTILADTNHSAVLAQLVGAAMPILMTRGFPLERERLFARFHTLVRDLPTRSATTGLDLATRPGQVLDRLASG